MTTAAIKTRATEHDKSDILPWPALDGLPVADLDLGEPTVKFDLVALAATVTFLFADTRTRYHFPEGTGRAAMRFEFVVSPPGYSTRGKLAVLKGTDAREPSEWRVNYDCERYEWQRDHDGALTPQWRTESKPSAQYGKLLAKAKRAALSLGRLALTKAIAAESQTDILASFVVEKEREVLALTERARDLVSENDNHKDAADLLYEAHAAHEQIDLICEIAARLGLRVKRASERFDD